MGEDFGICIAPRGGVPGLDLAALPVVPDPAGLDFAAKDLQSAGAGFREAVATTATNWNALAVPFRTQELPDLLAAFTPVSVMAVTVDDATSVVAAALSEFATVCQAVKTLSGNLTQDAATLSSRIDLKGDDWATVPAIVDEQHRLLGELNKIKARFAQAEQDCANKIHGVYGGTRYVGATDANARADGSNVYAVDAPTLDALAEEGKLPWGVPVERAKLHGWAGAAQGALDTLWETAGAAYSLSWMSAIARPSVPELGLEQTPSGEDTLKGLGKTLWNIGTFISPGIWLDRAITGKQEDQDAAATELSQALPAMVHAEAWAKGEWEYALTRNTIDLGAALATGGGTTAVRVGALLEKVLADLAPATSARISDTIARVKIATLEHALKPALHGMANVLDHLDDGAGAVRVTDDVAGLGRGPLGGLAEDLLQGIDRLDQAAHRPPAIGTLGRAAEHHQATTELVSTPHHNPSKPSVQHLVHVPESMVPGPRTPWTKVTEGFAPNTEYRVPGRGTFITDANGTITEAVITKVKDTLNPDLNNPLPDMTYKVEGVKGEVIFKTDEYGHTKHVSVVGLELGDGQRSPYIQGLVGRESTAEIGDWDPDVVPPDYDGGHLIARLFDGIGERINTVGMLKELNRSSVNRKNFYRIEMQLRDKLLEVPPPKIDLEIKILRVPGLKTPTLFKVRAWENGEGFVDEDFVNVL